VCFGGGATGRPCGRQGCLSVKTFKKTNIFSLTGSRAHPKPKGGGIGARKGKKKKGGRRDAGSRKGRGFSKGKKQGEREKKPLILLKNTLGGGDGGGLEKKPIGCCSLSFGCGGTGARGVTGQPGEQQRIVRAIKVATGRKRGQGLGCIPPGGKKGNGR